MSDNDLGSGSISFGGDEYRASNTTRPVPEAKPVAASKDLKLNKWDFLPSDTPIPFWADVIIFFIWCGAVGLSIVTAFFLANLFLGVAVFIGAGVGLFFLRSMIKKFLADKA